MQNKKQDFSEWYNEIIEISGLSDKRYPVKGMNVWLPYGWRLMRSIDTLIRESVDNYDFQEVSFPVLITRDQLEVEFEHVKGFEGEIFWVTRGGKEPLDVEMALRPTSEAAMYPMYSVSDSECLQARNEAHKILHQNKGNSLLRGPYCTQDL